MKRKTESPGAAIFNRLIVLGFIITGAFSSFSSFASVLTNEPQAAYIRPVTNALVRETSATSSNVVFSPVVAAHWSIGWS